MKLNTQSITADLDSIEVPLEDRSYVLALAFARAVGYALPLPTSPVDNPYVAFTTLHSAEVEALASQLNERAVIDVDTVVDLTSRIWIFRVRMLYDATNSTVRQFLDSMIKVGSREIPPKTSEFLIKYEASDAVDRMTKYMSVAMREG